MRLFAATLALAALVNCSDSRDSADTVMEGGADGPAVPPLAFDFRNPADGEAHCRFVIDPNVYTTSDATPLPEAQWTTFVDGLCGYTFIAGSSDNAFDMGTLVLDEIGPPARVDAAGDFISGYFVYLNFSDRDFVTADGSWNGKRERTHAHTTIGSVPDYPMRRDGECWVSDRARICLTR